MRVLKAPLLEDFSGILKEEILVRVLKAPLLEDFSGILKEEILVRVLRYLKGCLALDGCAGARPSDAGTWLQISPLM